MDSKIFDRSEDEIFSEPEKYKKYGDSCLKGKKYQDALIHYETALEKLKMIFSKHSDCLVKNFSKATQLINTIGIPCHLNMSLCYYHLEKWNESVAECTKVLELDKKNIKAIYRRCKCEIILNKFNDAERDLNCILYDKEKYKELYNELENKRKLIEEQNTKITQYNRIITIMIAVFGIVDAKLKCLPFYWVIEWCYGLVVSYYNFLINCYMKCKCIFIDTPLSYYAKGKNTICKYIDIAYSYVNRIRGFFNYDTITKNK